MTTDITELAQREKFEAWWERTQHNGNPPRFGWEYWRDGEGYKVDDDESELDGMWEAWKAAGAELVEALEKAQTINAAAEKLVRCKGRYHSEQNYRALAALFGVTAPDLPPLDGESRTVTVKPEDADGVREEGNQFLVVRHPGKVPVIKHPVGHLEDYLLQILKADPLATIDIVTHRYYGVGGQFVEDADEYLHEMGIKWEAD